MRVRHAFIFLMAVLPAAASAQETVVGPPRGSLVIVGGNIQDLSILRRFIDLAGGPDVPIVVIPTAGGAPVYDEYWSGLKIFREAGARNLTVLHTIDRSVANSEGFVAPLKRARGVFFWEGRQWRLADSYLNTLTHREIQGVLDRGGVVGGSSAGASIQGSFLMRGDTKTSDIIIGDHTQGLGFMRNVGIDQHVLIRNREWDMLEVLKVHPDLLGLALDENTAIVVQQDEFEVIGKSYVIIYDNKKQIPPNGPFYFLRAGDRYNLATREAARPAQTTQPFARVQKK
ncbi:MAG: peptidase S51 [Gemmatimonadetes bacterium]|nr:peptidase S51 [Gemmatimonadota bacterium]